MLSSLSNWLDVRDGEITSLWVNFARAWPIWALLAAAAGIVLAAWWAYRPSQGGALERPREGGPAGRGLPAGRRWVMAVLRGLAILLLIVILLEPTAEFRQTLGIKPTLIVMLDDSQSMTIRDRRLSADDRSAVEKVLGSADVPEPSRAELLSGLWNSRKLELERRLGDKYDLRFYRFSQKAHEAAGRSAEAAIKELAFDGAVTDLGQAIRHGGAALRGRPAAGIVLFTDGVANRGETPSAAARAAGDTQTPVFTVGLGLPQARDLAIASFLCDDVVFINDTVRVSGKIAQRGYGIDGGDAVTVELRRDNEVLARKSVPLSGSSEESFEIQFVPKAKGEANYRLVVENRPDELIPSNNSREKRIKVIDEAIKVLIVEQAPRWDFRFLRGSLVRDKRVQLRVHVREADSRELAGAGMPEYLPRIPDKREELFKFDVIILGDVPASAFSSEQLKLLEEFVSSNGGGLVFAAGPRYNPSSYAKTALEPLVPVVFSVQPEPTPETELLAPFVQPLHFEITAEGRASPVCALADTDAANANIWRRLPAFYWHFQAQRLRPAATALAVLAESPVKDGKKLPLIAHQFYGRGMTFYLGMDSLWRWRDQVGTRHFVRFWGQTINFLSMAHLLGQSRRVQIALDGKTFSVGDAVGITARVLDKSYQPLKAASVSARVGPEGQAEQEGREVELRELPNQPGMFAGEFRPLATGDYAITVKGEEAEGKVTFTVQQPQLEFDRPAMDEQTLRVVADVSGGRFFRADETDGLPEAIAAARPVITVAGRRSIWDRWPMLAVIVTLLCIELIIRKRSDLA